MRSLVTLNCYCYYWRHKQTVDFGCDTHLKALNKCCRKNSIQTRNTNFIRRLANNLLRFFHKILLSIVTLPYLFEIKLKFI